MKSTWLKMSVVIVALIAIGSFDAQGLIPNDPDGDGVPNPTDQCPAENASHFDRNGDGCIDAFTGARHIEYWGTADATVSYVINATAAPNITNGTDITAVQSAVSAWTAVANTNLNVTYGGTTTLSVANGLDRINLVTFIDNTFPFSSLVLAVGLSTSFETDTLISGRVFKKGEIFDADMVFNPTKTFKTSGNVGVDIQSVATHEAGHLWGLSHSTVQSATMFYALPGGNAARTLANDDRLVYFKAYGTTNALANANRIQGTVTRGGTGTPIPGAIVFIINSANGDTAACDYTLPNGKYTFPGLANGSYYVSIHALDGTSPIGFIQPGNINALVQETAVTNFAAESYDAAESAADDPTARTALTLNNGNKVATANIITNIDATPPTVLSTTPGANAPAAPVDGAYVIEFSEPVAIGTVVASFTFRDNLTNAAKGGTISIVRDDSVLVFLPSPPLEFGKAYTLTIDTDLKDKAGNSLASNFTLALTTEAEPALAVSSLAPNKSIVGNTVVINGRGFDTAPVPTVRFGNIVAAVSSATLGKLVVTVPANAITGPVTVTNADLAVSNALTFTVLSAAEVARGFESGQVTFSVEPNAVAVSPSGEYAYAATQGGAEASVVSPSLSNYLSHTTIPYAGALDDIAITPSGARAYAISGATGELIEIMSDPTTGLLFNKVLSSRALGATPKGIVINPNGDRAYIATDESEVQVWDIRLGSPTYQHQISSLPWQGTLAGPMAVTPAGDRLLVVSDAGEVVFFDASETVPSAPLQGPAPRVRITSAVPPLAVSVGALPRGIVIDPQGERAYVSHDNGDISIVNIEGAAPFQVQDIVTGGSLSGLAITPAGFFLYATDRVLDNIKIVDLDESHGTFRSVVEDIEAPGNPMDVVISPDGFYAFTILQGSSSPTIESKLLVSTIGLGPEMQSLYPLSGKPGTKVIISGIELGHSDIGDVVSVDFNGIVVPADLQDHVEVVATVPVGMTSGPVRLVVHNSASNPVNQTSNSLPFEIIPNFTTGGMRLAASIGVTQGAIVPVIAMRPQGDLILVGNDGGAAVQAIDIRPGSPTFHQEIRRMLPFGHGVSDIAITADGKTAFMVNNDDGQSRMVPAINCDPNSPGFGDERTTLGGGQVFATPLMVRTSPENRWVMMWDNSAQEIYIFDAVGVSEGSIPGLVATINGSAAFVSDMAFHPSGRFAYIARTNPNAILVVDMDENGIAFGIVQAVVVLPGALPNETPFSIQISPDGTSMDVLGYALQSGPATRHILRYPLANNGGSLGTPTQYALPNGSTGGDYLEHLRVSPRGDVGIIASRAAVLTMHDHANPSNTIGSAFVFEALSTNEFEFTPDGARMYFASTFHDSVRVYDFYGGTADLYYLAVASGDNQNGVVNQELPAHIRARTIGEGLSLPGLTMTFRVTSGGGGFVTPNNVVDEINVATDTQGFADVRWQLGPGLGRQAIQVIAEGIDRSPVEVVATAGQDPNALPLTIAEVLPLNNSSNVSGTTAVLTTFSRAVDPASIAPGSLFIEVTADATKIPATFGFTDSGRKVSLTPSAPLNYSTQFRVVYNAGVKDENGGSLTNPGNSLFTTQAAPPPSLAAVAPPSALRGVSITLSGAGFDPIPANNQVLFNGVVAVPTSGTTTKLIVVIPVDAVTGTVAVRRGALTSNTKPFTVLTPNTSPIDEVIASVGTGSGVKSCAVTPDGALCYTVSPDGDVVVPVDINGETAFPAINVGDQPVAIVIHPDGTFAYVANFNSGSVSVIDVRPASANFNKVVTTITVGPNPSDLVVLPDGDRVLVANAGAGDVSVIDGNDTSASFHQVIASVGTGSGAKSLAVTPDGARLYIGNDSGFVVLEMASYGVVASVGTGSGCKSLAVTPDGTMLFILGTNGTILIVDITEGSNSENQVIASVGAGSTAKSLALSPDGTLLYVVQENSDEVLVFSINVIPGVSVMDPDAAAPSFRVTTALVHTVTVGADPSFVAIDPSGSGKVFVANTGDKTLSILNSVPPLDARFEFFPPILIVKIKNPYVTGWVQLPTGYRARDIDVNSVRLNGTVPAIPNKVVFFDFNFDHVEDVLFVFKKDLLVATLDPDHLLQQVHISGNVLDRKFTGEDWLLALFPHVGNNNVVVLGEPNRISWETPEGHTANVADVHVSLDNGQSWQPIGLQIPNTGEVMWLPPEDAMFRNGIFMVTLYENGEILIQGTSAVPFTVALPQQTTTLKSFDAVVEDGTAVLRWETLVEAGMSGFQVVRADAEDGTYTAIGEHEVPATGDGAGARYELRDEGIRGNRTYWYKLQEVKTGGLGLEFGPYSLTYRVAFGLEQNVPNPFNPTTAIKYSIAQDVNVSLVVYDVAGRRVRTLVNEKQRADAYRVTWDGLNDTGERVASGMYFYKLAAGPYTQTKKMMLLK